jgi:hypothetical protein
VDVPLSLQQLARRAVHAALQQLPRTAVSQLQIPETLREYLLFSDLDQAGLVQDLEEIYDTILNSDAESYVESFSESDD